jgi:hypothetical protein
MLASASEEESRAIQTIATVEMRPWLVAAAVDRSGRMLVRVARPARGHPGPETFSFWFADGAEKGCPRQGVVSEWRALEGSELSAAVGGGQAGAWLDRQGLDARFYSGDTWLPTNVCPPRFARRGAILELEGAEPKAARTQVQ